MRWIDFLLTPRERREMREDQVKLIALQKVVIESNKKVEEIQNRIISIQEQQIKARDEKIILLEHLVEDIRNAKI
jgi:hypothetical protein